MAKKKIAPEALAVPEQTAPQPDMNEVLSKKLDVMNRLLEEQILLQRVALLEAGHIFRFSTYGAQRVALSLPDAANDMLQRAVLRTRGFFEARLLGVIREFGIVTKDSVVCDVGANIGNHTVFFGRVLGAHKVMSFEPQKHYFEALSANIALNGMQDHSRAFNCMVGARKGAGQVVEYNPRNLGATAFTASETGDVAMVALDDVVQPEDVAKLDLIKIDVEGMQMDVLKGAAGILGSRRPALWVELWSKTDHYEIAAAWLAKFGYEPTRIGANDVLFRA